ncbi:sulfotransferase domain-containing protein [candidate division KSB1 bacterium]|nr:sulfotransferase domain-containing protein [candidate division KSB1 bacterium]
MQQKTITVVSGLPRSGTSMMMKILEAGGLNVLTDHIRSADEDNPKGYYEFERVKALEDDRVWLEEAVGKVVKIISALLSKLPDDYHYQIIFMHRKMDEILASQKKMLERRGEPTDAVADEEMTAAFIDHLGKVNHWLNVRPNVDTLHVDYNDTIANPEENVKRINQFLGNRLNEEKMLAAIDQRLYRNK